MQTNEGRCRWCGRDLFWIYIDGRRTAIEQGYTPYKLVEHPRQTLYTQLGKPLPCEILPRSRESEADGWQHIPHICPKSPRLKANRPQTMNRYR